MKTEFQKAASSAKEAVIAFCLSILSFVGLPNILNVVELPSALDERGLLLGGILCGIWYSIVAGTSGYQAINKFGSALRSTETKQYRDKDSYTTQSISL